MMADQQPVVLPIRISASYEGAKDGAMKIIEVMRPNWHRNQVIYKPLKNGHVNYCVCCHLVEDVEMDDAFVVRVHSDQESLFNWHIEIPGLQLAYAAGCGNQVLAVFKNGVVYRYAKGKTLDLPLELHDESKQIATAKAVAQLHQICPSSLKLIDQSGARTQLPFYTCFDRMQDWINTIPEKLDDEKDDKRYQLRLKSLAEYTDEVQHLKDEFRQEPFIFGHNDVYGSNVIYNTETGTATLIDFDHASYTIAALEWGTLFSGAFWLGDFRDAPNNELGDEVLQAWLRPYLAHCKTLQGNSSDNVMEGELSNLTESCRKCFYVSHFYTGLNILSSLSCGGIRGMDSIRTGFDCVDFYFENRQHVFSK